MPWPHCGADLGDDVAACPSCGISKQEWTIKVNVTRRFKLSGKRSLKLELLDEAGGYLADATYTVELSDGTRREGKLNAAGYAKVLSEVEGDARVSFLGRQRDVRAVTSGLEQPEANVFVCAFGPDKHTFQLVPGLDWIEVLLVDDLGAPVAGEVYEVVGRGVRREGTLDANGLAREDKLPPGAYTIRFPRIDWPDWDPLQGRWRDEPDGVGTAWIAFDLHDDLGEPEPDVPWTLLLPGGGRREGVTGPGGFVRIDGIPEGACTLRFTDIDAPDWAPLEGEDGAPDVPEERDGAWIAFELKDDLGAPVADEPYVLSAADGSEREGTTGPDGAVWVGDLPAGLCHLRFPRLDLSEGASPRRAAPPDEGPRAGAWVAFALEDDLGQPVAGEPYEVELPDGSKRAGTTGPDGAAHVDELEPGSVTVRFPRLDAADHDPLPGAVAGPTAPDEGPRAGAWVAFALEDDLGQPVAGEPYEVELPDGSKRAGTTGPDGAAHVDELEPGSVTVRFPRLDAADHDPLPGAVAGPTAPDEGPRAGAWVAFALEDDLGQPVAGEPYEVELPDGSKRAGTTGPDGAARVADLPEGTVTLRFPRLDAADHEPPPVAKPTPPPSDAPPPPPATAWVAADLRDEAGHPLPGVAWRLTAADGSERQGVTDDQGALTCAGLPEGPCTLHIPDIDQADWLVETTTA